MFMTCVVGRLDLTVPLPNREQFRQFKLQVNNPMANSPQAKKRVRTNETRARINSARRSRVRTFLKKVELAISSNDQVSANQALQTAQSELMRGVSRGVFKKNTANRTVSRLNARIKAMSA